MRRDHAEETGPAPDGRPAEQQPKWRQDFPVDWPQDEYIARRDLVKFLLLTSLAFVVGQVSLLAKRGLGRDAAEALPARAIATLDELPVGGAKVFTYPERSTPRILLRLGASEFVAYDQQCTHLQCPIVPRLQGGGRLHCPCHEGWFDAASGRPLAGPPRRPLPRVTLELRDGHVFATGVELRS